MTPSATSAAIIEITARELAQAAHTFQGSPKGGKVRASLILAMQTLEGRLRTSLAILAAEADDRVNDPNWG